MRFLLTGFLVVLIMSFHMPSAMAQPCPADGDVNQDGRLTPGDALLVFRHFLGIVDPPLTACQQDRANVIKPNSTPLTPEDALCIIQEFLRLPSCLAAQSATSDETDIRVLVNTPFPLNVDIVDAADQPVEEAQVSFRITAGDGSLSTTTVSTDADGKATTTLTVGALPGLNVVEAQVAGLAPLTFTIIGVIPENVRALVEARGIPLAVTQGASIDIPLIVQVEDQFGVPVAEVEVTADIFQGETQTMTLLARTNVQGEASLRVQAVLGDEDIVAKVSLPGQTIVVPLVINNTIVAPNAAPVVASPGALMAVEGEAVALQLVAIDPDGDPLVFGATNLPLGLSIGPDTGLIAGTVDPAAAQVSPYIVTITATDGTVTTTVSFVLTVRNPSPVLATIGNQAIDAGSTQAVAVTANDPDGDELTLTATGLPTFAVFTDNGDGTGTLILAPGSDDAGIFPGVAITVTDTSSPRGTDSQTFTLTVNTMNRRPVAEAGADQTVPLGVTVSLDGSASTDPDGDVPLGFQWALVSIPIGSRATLSDNNTIRPIFMTDVTGLYVVELQVNDGRLTANPDTVLINAVTTQVNNLPIGLGDAYTVNEDNTLTTTAANGVLANDGTVDGDLLTARLVRGVLHGTLEAFNADGSFTYRPNGNFNGVDSFTYTANGANVASNILMVSITVTPVNDVPRAIGDTYSVAEDTALTIRVANGVLANDSDPHDVPSDTLVATRVSDPSHGTLDAFHSDGSFIYRPHAHFTGIDTFTYQVSDDGGTANGGTDTGNIATVSLTVISVNDPPVATADVYTLNEDTALAVTTAAGVLANDSDPQDVPPDTLVATRVSSPSRGELEAFRSDGSFTYRPHAHFVGTDTFTYQVSDNGGTTNGGTNTGNIVTVSLTVIAVNAPPVATADAYALNEDAILEVTAAAGVLANDADDHDEPPHTLSARRVSDPSHGTLDAFRPDGSFIYRPHAHFTGTDTFTYQVSDDGGTTNGGTDTGNIVTVSLTVIAVNDPPVATADVYALNEDTILEVTAAAGVLANDADDHDEPPNTLSAMRVSDPSHGTLETFHPDGSFTYRPHAHFVGTDTFTYQVSDNGGRANGGSDAGNIVTVRLTVISVNDPPVATADIYTLNEDTALAVTTAAGVLANDSDPHDVPPDTLVATRVSSPSRGELEAFRSDGSFTYRPHAHFVGTDTFTYQVSDNGGTTNGGTNTGNIVTVSLTVIAVNDPPVATADAYHLSDDDILEVPVEAGVLANDSDPNDVPPDRLVATRLRDPSHGVLEAFHPDGSFTYRPDEGYAGTDSFTYQVSDDGGTTNGGIDTGNIATVTISVENCPLIADAGQDQTVFVADTVTLTGSGSCDELLFQWSIIDTPPDSSAILSDPEAIMPTFVPDLQGTYVIELIVSDGTTNSEPVEIRITAVATAVIAKGIGLENPDVDPSFSLTIPDAPLKAFLTWQQIVGRNGMANANLTLRKTVTDASGDVVIEDKELSQRAGSPPEGSTDGYREGSVRCFLTDISDFISPGTTNTFTVLGVDTTFIPGAGIVVVSPIIPDETVEFDEAESGQPLSTIAKLTAGSVHGSRRHVEIQTGCDFFFFGAEGYENSDVITFDFAPAPVERQARITFLVGDAQSGNNARDNQILYFPDAYAPLYDPRCSYQGQPQCILGQNGTGLESNDGEHWDTFGRNSGLLPSDPNFNPGSEPSSDPDLRGVVTIPPCATFASFQLLSPDANLTGLSATVSMAVFEIETTETTGPSIECYYDYDPGQTCLYESC